MSETQPVTPTPYPVGRESHKSFFTISFYQSFLEYIVLLIYLFVLVHMFSVGRFFMYLKNKDADACHDAH